MLIACIAESASTCEQLNIVPLCVRVFVYLGAEEHEASEEVEIRAKHFRRFSKVLLSLGEDLLTEGAHQP